MEVFRYIMLNTWGVCIFILFLLAATSDKILPLKAKQAIQSGGGFLKKKKSLIHRPNSL